MSDKRDYYEVLGVTRTATDVDIKKSYRRLAMKYHPDRNQGDKEAGIKFREIQEAYAVLSNAQKRQAYDQFGHAGVSGAAGGAGGFGFQDLGDMFGDIFGDMFGGGRGGQAQQRGADLGYELVINLEEAVHGCEKDIDVPTWAQCDSCDGAGAKKGSAPVECQQCRGAGQVRMQHGFIAIQQTCPACRGQGKVIKDPCSSCRGQGRVQKRKTLNVKIPPGIDTGDRIRLAGEGEAGFNGAPAGDLFVQIRVKPHKIFTRHGNDLHCEVPISFVNAVMGGDIEVPTIDGSVNLHVDAETQTGRAFRLRGKGVKALRSGAIGDLLCKVVVETPINLSDAQKDLLKQFQDNLDQDGKDHSPNSKGWFASVKDFFKGK